MFRFLSLTVKTLTCHFLFQGFAFFLHNNLHNLHNNVEKARCAKTNAKCMSDKYMIVIFLNRVSNIYG